MEKQELQAGSLTGSSSVQDREGVDPDGGGVEERQRAQPIGNTVLLEEIIILFKAMQNPLYYYYYKMYISVVKHNHVADFISLSNFSQTGELKTRPSGKKTKGVPAQVKGVEILKTDKDIDKTGKYIIVHHCTICVLGKV